MVIRKLALSKLMINFTYLKEGTNRDITVDENIILDEEGVLNQYCFN